MALTRDDLGALTKSVESTNDAAVLAKRSAVELGYYSDPFINYFKEYKRSDRRTPEIHLGYYTRVQGVQKLVSKASSIVDSSVQIVNLGCGYDTLFWRLMNDDTAVRSKIKKFVEIDLPQVISSKGRAIKKSTRLMDFIGPDFSTDTKEIRSSLYHTVAVNLSDISGLESKLKSCSIDFDFPTIFISECVFVYMEPSQSENLLSWLSNKFSNCLLINHEQLNIEDKFGAIMVSNLKNSGTDLPGLINCKDKETLKSRFTRCNWAGTDIWSMNEVYARLPSSEITRVERIEFLDERELVNQLFEHYCISVSWKGDTIFKDSLNIDWWSPI